MSDITLRHTDGAAVQFEPVTGERRELLKRTIGADLADNELDLFIAVCNRRRLDPFVGQIHAVKRRDWNGKLNDGKGGYEEKLTIQTGIDGYRLVADRTHQRDGIDGPWWCDDSGVWREAWFSKDPPAAAKVIVYRKGHTRGYVGIAHWAEYVQTYKDKQGNVQPTSMWRGMPAGQLAKCAEALASRKAFPEELSGIYTDEEMGQADETPAGLAATQAAPASPAAPASLPTHQQIDAAANTAAAVLLAKHAPPDYQDAVKQAASTMTSERWETWSRRAPLGEWQVVLHHALQSIETSAPGRAELRHRPVARPTPESVSAMTPGADHQSDPAADAPTRSWAAAAESSKAPSGTGQIRPLTWGNW